MYHAHQRGANSRAEMESHSITSFPSILWRFKFERNNLNSNIMAILLPVLKVAESNDRNLLTNNKNIY